MITKGMLPPTTKQKQWQMNTSVGARSTRYAESASNEP